MPLGSVSPFRATGTVSLPTSNVSANAPLTGGGTSVVVTNPSNILTFIRVRSRSQRWSHRLTTCLFSRAAKSY